MDAGPDIESALRPYVPDLLLGWPEDCAWQELEGTMVSADISGFTTLAERLAERGREGAEELNALISGCFEGMIEHCDRYGGDIVKFGGDALLVWFTGDGHAARACRAAVGMRRTIRQRRSTSDGRLVRLAVSTGVHAGRHHFFAIHSGCHDLIVSGPGATQTVAAESAASAGEILLSPATAPILPANWLGAARPEGVTLQRLTTAQRVPPPLDSATVRRAASEFVSEVQQAQVMAGALNEHRQVAVSFVAFSGTDALIAAGKADELSDRLRAVAGSIAASCERFGVFLLATDVNPDGGKFMMAAGAPLSRGGDDERMLRAVRDIVDADPGLGLRAGVTRGYVFGCDLGSDRRRVYTVMGDAVNLSARLMAKAGPGEIIVSRPTMEWASSRFEYEPLEPFLVKGKRVPVYAGRLGRHLGRRTDLDQVDTELCGRSAEVAMLLGAADAARAGRGSVVVITGEAGIGKSRLAVEVVRQRLDFTVVFARCQPFDRLTAYAVTEPILRPLFGIDLESSPADAGAALVAWLAEHSPDALALAPLLAVAIGADVPSTAEADAVIPTFRRVRTLQLLSDVIGRAIIAPTAILIDDVNHADDATREFLEVLATTAADVPLLIVTTSASEETTIGEQIALGRLDEPAVVGMIDALLGNRPIAPSTVRSIVQRAAGNPLFVGELLRSLAEDSDAEVPSSLEALVESRIDTLEPADRQLLRNASVLGSEVDITLLGQMSDDALIRRQDRWDRLDRFLERVGPGVVRFRYDTYHRVVYGGLSYRTRRALHRRVITVLERAERVDSLEHLALLTFHAHHSGDRDRTWRYGTAAAAAAAGAAMFGEAARLYGLALAAHAERSPNELRLVAEQAGDVFEVVGQLEAAERALALATRHSSAGLDQARLWRKRAEVAERLGHNVQARRRLGRAAKSLKGVPWSAALGEYARWESARSAVALHQSRLGEAWNYATSALSKAQLVEDWKTAAHAALMVDNLVTNLRWEGVVVQRPDVVELCRRAGDPVGEAKYLGNRAVDHYFDGEWPEAVRLYRESAERSAEYGHAVMEATCLNNIAEILSDQGRYVDARAMFREASRTWRSIGYGLGIAYADSNLGRLATRTGRHDDARELLDAAADGFAALGSTSDLIDVALRTIEDRLVAGDTVEDDMWPASAELDTDPTLHAYADRLRSLAADEPGEAAVAIDRSIATARAAGVPFELALSLRVRATIADDASAGDEADEILRRLEVVTPPPLPGVLGTRRLADPSLAE